MPEYERFVLSLLSLLAVAGAGLAAETPLAVSPGDASKLSVVEGRCPTFSWGAAEAARSYDLVVYRLVGEGEEAEPVLEQRIAGSALSWTPPLDRCLARGGRYAWGVRALGDKVVSEWSQPNLFQVTSGPSTEEFGAALEIVRTYLAARGEAVPEAATEEAARPPAASDKAAARAPTPLAPPPGTQMSVDGNVDAASFSGSGALLTGLDPANMSAGTAGIDISGNAATATDAATASDLVCTNCIGTAEIDRTGFDADLLDGLDSSIFATTGHDHLGETWTANPDIGLWLETVTGTGLRVASHSGTGLFAQAYLPSGHAGVFIGRTYVSRLGIGNAAPDWPLSIYSPQAVAQLWSTDHPNGSVVELKNSATSPTFLGAINFSTPASTPGQIAYQADNAMTFRTNNAERLRITSAGDVTNGLGLNGLVKAWAVIKFDGSVEACWRCDPDPARTRRSQTGVYVVGFDPVLTDLSARPVLCSSSFAPDPTSAECTGLTGGEALVNTRSVVTGVLADTGFTVVVF